MQIRIDVGHVPPLVEVGEPEDFSRFGVVVTLPSHAWIDPDVLAALAGRSADPAWREELAGMVRYAGSKGWLDAQGRIRAHVDVTAPGQATP